MRSLRLPTILFALAACGGDNGTKPDAGNRPDAPKPDDGGVDSPGDIDAPIDGTVNPGGMTRLWAIGDILTNNATIAVGFDNTTTLPIGNMTQPPVKIPATGELFDGAGSTDFVFSACATKVAYVADATQAGRFDVNVANVDGTGNVVAVTGGQAGVEITSVWISPDCTKVAYTMDSLLLNGSYDLHLVPAAGGASVKISPDRQGVMDLANMDVFPFITWSRDSKYLAYSADLVESAYDQAWVVDTSVAQPTSVELFTRNEITATTGARGVRGSIQFDTANNLFFRARLGTAETFAMYRATAAGAASRMPLTLPARTDNSTPDAASFGITPDGNTLVFSVDAPTPFQYDFYSMPANGGATTRLTTLAAMGHAQFTAPTIAFSPDGKYVAVNADYSQQMPTHNEPFVIALDGTTQTPVRLVNLGACAGTCNGEVITWSADSQSVYLQGDFETADNVKVYKQTPTGADQTPSLAVDLPTGGDMVQLFALPY